MKNQPKREIKCENGETWILRLMPDGSVWLREKAKHHKPVALPGDFLTSAARRLRDGSLGL